MLVKPIAATTATAITATGTRIFITLAAMLISNMLFYCGYTKSPLNECNLTNVTLCINSQFWFLPCVGLQLQD